MTNIETAINMATMNGTSADGAPSFALTDSGNAERFAAQHGNRARFVAAWKTWLLWDGKVWRHDDRHGALLLAKATARSFDAEIANTTDDEARKRLRTHAIKSESKAGIENMVALARAELAASPEDFDRDPMLYNVANGTIDLRTGALHPHRVDDLITRIVPIDYAPSATCPEFEAFLSKVLDGNADLIRYMQKAIGYSLTGSVAEQCFFFMFGSGANGKSTLADLLLRLLGPYGKVGAPDLLVTRHNDQHPAEQADLEGARFVICQEIAEGRSWNERTLKHLTGGDRIKARLMHQNWREFDPTHKLWIGANAKPKMNDGGDATWRRVRTIPFEVVIPDHERDRNLGTKLAAELPGILRWAVEGCQAWLREGLTPPAAVSKATADYREESDHVATYVEERLMTDPEARAAKSAVFEAYTLWCRANREVPLTREALSKRLQARGLAEVKGGAGVRFWAGVALRDVPGRALTWPAAA